MAGPEQKIQKSIIKWLEDEGHYVVKVISASKAGVPDILCCVRGKFVAIEVKTPGTQNNISPLQAYNLDKVNICGGLAIAVWSLEQVKEAL
jgi:Holliday junction resolvase